MGERKLKLCIDAAVGQLELCVQRVFQNKTTGAANRLSLYSAKICITMNHIYCCYCNCMTCTQVTRLRLNLAGLAFFENVFAWDHCN